jgi:hypothetical protein
MRNSWPTPSGKKPIVMHASDALTPDIHPHESRKTQIYQEPDAVTTDPKVREQLCLVQRQQPLD